MLVVIGHLLELMRNNLDMAKQLFMFIYIFHMPMFIMISGYFSKAETGLGALKKHFYRILLPFLTFQFSLVVIYFFYHPLTINSLIKISLTPQFGLWYLLCLFVWRVILPYFDKLPYPLLLSVIIGLLGGIFAGDGFLFSSSRMLAFFPYFVLGYYIKKNELSKILYLKGGSTTVRSIKIIGVIILIFALGCSVILNGRLREFFMFIDPKLTSSRILYASRIIQEFFMHFKFYPQFQFPIWLSILFRSIAYATSILAGFSFILLVPKSHTLITRVGKQSLYVYLLHSFVLYFFVVTRCLEEVMELKYFVLITLAALPLTLALSSDIVKKATIIFVEPATVINKRLFKRSQRDGQILSTDWEKSWS